MSNDALPQKAVLPRKDNHPGGDPDAEPHTVGHLEQLLRVDLTEGGLKHGLQFARNTLGNELDRELNEYFDLEKFQNEFVDVGNADPYLTSRMEDIKGQIRSLRAEREDYYKSMAADIEERIDKAVKGLQAYDDFNSASIGSGTHGAIEFTERTVVKGYDEETEFDPLAARDVDSHAEASLSDFGYTYPQDLIVVNSASGSMYPMVPWYGVLVCTCGDKIVRPDLSPFCKHEIAALLLDAQGIFQKQVPNISPRFRRLVNYEIYTEHKPAEKYMANAAP